MAHPFFVGGHYRDRNQGYEVISMSDSGMVVRYEDGSEERIDQASMAIKARIYNNMLAEYGAKHPVDSEAYFRSLGFLAAKSRFEAELPNRIVGNFLDQYKRLTGDELSASHPNLISLGDVDKYGAELRIYFPDPPIELDFGPGIEVRAGQSDGMKRINNNSLWNKLLRLGFRIGKDHDHQQIRESIPQEKRYLFDEGLHT